VRSRALIAIVFAITARMIRITTYETIRIAAMIWSDIATKPSWNACSLSVSVSASELRNSASMFAAIAAALVDVFDAHDIDAGEVGAPLLLAHRLVQVVKMETACDS
jgi:hypothetical protein